MDHSIQLIPPRLPDRPVDFSTIKVAVEKAVEYLRTSQYGIDIPKLYEDVGAFFADDVVPQVLHKEVRASINLATYMTEEPHSWSANLML
jgi:hypothetical protein